MSGRSETALPPIGPCAECGAEIEYGTAYFCGDDRKLRHSRCGQETTDAERQTTDFDREFEVNGAIAIVRGYADRVALLRSAYDDAISALRYIRLHHGDLYGVGWDRLDDTYAKVYPDD